MLNTMQWDLLAAISEGKRSEVDFTKTSERLFLLGLIDVTGDKGKRRKFYATDAGRSALKDGGK